MKTLLLTMLGVLALPARAEPLVVAAASDLTYSIGELADAFRKQAPGVELKTSLGSSGNFFAQIKNGAPFHVFLSADMMYPQRLAAEGAADGATLTTYAIGRLALWTLDPRFDLRQGMAVFRDARLARVAIANPQVAPYGMAARAALQHHGVWDAVSGKLVLGENIAQTAQFVQTGNAQVGVVSYATVLAPRLKGVGSYYLVPQAGLAPIEQGAILTARGKGHPAAARFMQFLHSPTARAILQRHGFGLPPAKHA
ncbi:molybdate ABC transporter substrate-binding protein [Massilia sp. PAMC28688]|uniref:molybdate ABC transporter substrate-binding protein n=1 Tax=Massilia sp. PAMC28688 TaxID=2861283 RepID=UPI001C62906C|nr:molybdate ABC transporter substrate-binding protein [Massilia sp. PAMC28688]QYF95360.1 molybdate ABC transporter substrate-binding protein [Massilia sp. PAMC28688]